MNHSNSIAALAHNPNFSFLCGMIMIFLASYSKTIDPHAPPCTLSVPARPHQYARKTRISLISI